MGSQIEKDEQRFIERIKTHKWQRFIDRNGIENEVFIKVMLSQFDSQYRNCWKMKKQFCYLFESNKKKGALYKQNNSYYMGTIKNGQENGEGVILYFDRLTYKGQFEKGIPHGGGTLYDFNLQIIQEGNFVYGKFVKGRILGHRDVIDEVEIKREGDYRIIYKNGSKYTGKGFLKNNQFWRHGKGKFEIPSQLYEYNGEWKMNRKEGIATVKHRDSLFEGQYKDDVRYKGKLKQKIWEYIGDWKDGQIFSGRIYNKSSHSVIYVKDNQIQNR